VGGLERNIEKEKGKHILLLMVLELANHFGGCLASLGLESEVVVCLEVLR
jgi:hypothetical protein